MDTEQTNAPRAGRLSGARTTTEHTQDSTIVTVVTTNKRSIYVDVLTKSWAKVAQDLFEIGDALIQAKSELEHGEFTSMIESELPFGPRAARMLMAVARNTTLRNGASGSVLPTSWRTLYELTRLPAPKLEAALQDGTVYPSMPRKAVARLLDVAKAPAPAPVVQATQSSPSKLPAIGPPRDAMGFALLAIMDLEKIRNDDAERADAFGHVGRWLDERDADRVERGQIVRGRQARRDWETGLVLGAMASMDALKNHQDFESIAGRIVDFAMGELCASNRKDRLKDELLNYAKITRRPGA